MKLHTLPETNSQFAPENGWLEYGSFHCGAFRPAYFQVRFLAGSFQGPGFPQPGFHGIGGHRPTVSTSDLRQAVEQYRRLGWKRELAVQCYLDLVDSFKKTQTLDVSTQFIAIKPPVGHLKSYPPGN